MNFRIWFERLKKSQEHPAIKTLRNKLRNRKRNRGRALLAFLLASAASLTYVVLDEDPAARPIIDTVYHCASPEAFNVNRCVA